MAGKKQRLGREDWILAGFRTLAVKGHMGVKVEPIARDLGTTKGSFYWHFKDLPEYHAEMLKLWEARAFQDVLAILDQLPDPLNRLRRLIDLACGPRGVEYGGAAAEPALRDWMRFDPKVGEVVKRVDQKRLEWLEDCFTQAGYPDPDLARGLFGVVIGLEILEIGDQIIGANAAHKVLDGLLGLKA